MLSAYRLYTLWTQKQLLQGVICTYGNLYYGLDALVRLHLHNCKFFLPLVVVTLLCSGSYSRGTSKSRKCVRLNA